MRRFLLHIALFGALVGILLAAAEWVARQYPNSYSCKRAWLDANAARVRTLVLGGSHTYYAIRPDLLGGTSFNAANVSQPPEVDYWLLRKYFSYSRNLRNVVAVIDESNIFGLPLEEDPAEQHRAAYYGIYMGYPGRSAGWTNRLEVAHLPSLNRKLPLAARYLVTGRWKPECDSLGFGDTFDTPDSLNLRRMRAQTAMALERHRCKDWSRVAAHVARLDSMAAWCRECHVRLILVTPPMWGEFARQVPARQLQVMRREAQRLQAQYGAVYRDYMNDPRFSGTDFHDGDHLSKQGAAKFTAVLKRDFGL